MSSKGKIELNKKDYKKVNVFRDNKCTKKNINNNIIIGNIYSYFKNKMSILQFFSVLLIFFLPISLSKKNSKSLLSDNEITLIVKGVGGYRSFLSNHIVTPNSVIINGIKQDTPKINCLLNDPENNITLSWDSPLTKCDNMFYSLDIILSIDLSKFDSSKVTIMSSMFQGCSNLKTIKLENLNTSLVSDMNNMFSGCNSLISLNLSSFDTSLVTNMRNMFSSCSSLVSIDLSSFNTSLVSNLENTFYNACSLISLDLSNFNTSSLSIFRNTFSYCKSLVYVNLISFVEFGYVEINNLFYGENGNLTYCIDENKAPRIAASFSNLNKDCNNICFSESRKIIVEKKKCIDKCINDDIYIYEYNDICYKSEHININTDGDNSDGKITNINSENLENYISDSIESSETNKNTDYIIKSEFDEKTENNIISYFIVSFPCQKEEYLIKSEKIIVNF